MRRKLLKIVDWIMDGVIIAFSVGVGLYVAYVLILVFVIASFTIPTTSMSPTIIPGDRVTVDKVVTGARLLDIRSAAAGDSTKVWRTLRMRPLRRGDVMVFNFPHRDSWDTITMRWNQYYIKRCVAAPGDTFCIADFNYIANSDTLRRKISAEQLRRLAPDDSTARAENMRGYMADVGDSIDRWTIRDFGPIILPRRGMTIDIDPSNIRRYRQMIEWETGKKIAVTDSTVALDGSPIDSYQFRENYYFMAGDNSLHSTDSRYWGPVPEAFIVGRALFVWWSEDKETGKVRWNRIFKGLD